MLAILLVFLGGGLGSVIRHFLGVLAVRRFGEVALGTLAVNVTGSFLMGFAVGYLMSRGLLNTHLRPFFLVGFLGGYTTFSAFSLDAVNLWERGDVTASIVYILTSVLVSLLALLLGFFVSRIFV